VVDNLTNPYNGASEKGNDFSASYGANIGAISSGNVVYVIHHNNSINDEVGISGPVGLVHYQHINSRVRVGDSVNIGDTVGTQNGLPIDQYSNGTHIEVRYAARYNAGADTWTGQPWQDPAAIFAKLAGYTASEQTSSSIATNSSNVSPKGPCAPWDIGCIMNQIGNSSVLPRIGKAVLGGLLVLLGLIGLIISLTHGDIGKAVKAGIKYAK